MIALGDMAAAARMHPAAAAFRKVFGHEPDGFTMGWPKPKDVEMVWKPGPWKHGERIHTAVPEWWPSNRWPLRRVEQCRSGYQDRPYILKLKHTTRSTRFYVGVPGARLREHRGAYFGTLAEACGYFDKVIGFNAACVAFALSHRCVNGRWVRR